MYVWRTRIFLYTFTNKNLQDFKFHKVGPQTVSMGRDIMWGRGQADTSGKKEVSLVKPTDPENTTIHFIQYLNISCNKALISPSAWLWNCYRKLFQQLLLTEAKLLECSLKH